MTRAGFTLLELLVAIVIAGLIVAALGGGLRLGNRAWEVAQATSDDIGEVAAVQSGLRRLIERSYPLAERTVAARRTAFTGSPEAMQFLALPPAQLDAGGLTEWRLHLAAGVLSLAWRRAGSGAPPVEQPLLAGIAGIDAAYYGSRDRQEAAAWRAEWADAPFPPQLVRLRLAFADPARVWPDLLVAPAITVDALVD